MRFATIGVLPSLTCEYLSRVECVRWVTESLRSTKIVDDPGFHRLMKTGRPHYRLPKAKTVARDVHRVFSRVKDRVAKMLTVSTFDSGEDRVEFNAPSNTGVRRTSELLNRCLDITQRPPIRRSCCTL